MLGINCQNLEKYLQAVLNIHLFENINSLTNKRTFKRNPFKVGDNCLLIINSNDNHKHYA